MGYGTRTRAPSARRIRSFVGAGNQSPLSHSNIHRSSVSEKDNKQTNELSGI